MERMVADEVRKSAALSNEFKYLGGARQADFIGLGRYAGLNFDITTNTVRQARVHAARPYEPIVVGYDRPGTFTTFP